MKFTRSLVLVVLVFLLEVCRGFCSAGVCMVSIVLSSGRRLMIAVCGSLHTEL